MTTADVLRQIEPTVKEAVAKAHPGVVFTDVWVEPRTSWFGSEMVDIWAIYDGDVEDLSPPAKPSLATRLQDILWNMEIDASASLHLVAKADADDLKHETV